VTTNDAGISIHVPRSDCRCNASRYQRHPAALHAAWGGGGHQPPAKNKDIAGGPVRALPPTNRNARVIRQPMHSVLPTYSNLTDEADDILFSRIMANQGHVLQPLLPDRHSIPYSQRTIA